MHTLKRQKVKRLPFFLFIFASISCSFTRIPNSADMRGTYDAVVDNKKYLSPFHGFVWFESDLAEKYFRFGNAKLEKGRMEGDATALLLQHLFHAEGAHFSVTGIENQPPTYWKPKTVGKILAALDQKGTYDEKDKPAVVKKLVPIILERIPVARVAFMVNRRVEQLRNAIISWWEATVKNPIFSALAKNKKYFNFTPAQWKQSIKRVADLDEAGIEKLFAYIHIKEVDKPTYHAKLEAIEALKNFARGFKKIVSRQETNKKLLGDVTTAATILARRIFDSLGECGHVTIKKGEVERKYPEYMTHCVLLAFSYEKAKKPRDFIKYFQQFSPTILKDDAEEILRERFDEKLRIDDLASNLEKYGHLEKYYELIAYAEIKGAKQGLPPFSDHERVRMKGASYVNCGVNAMMNFIRVIMAILGLYDATLQEYDFKNIPEKTKAFLKDKGIKFDEAELDAHQKPLIAFFQKFSNAGIVQGDEIHQALSELLSNLPGVKYLQKVLVDGSKAPEKDNDLPSVHPLPGIDYGIHQAVDDRYYTFEFAGYPSGIVAMVNHFFGFGVSTLPDLFALLGMEMSGVDPGGLNDKDVYRLISMKLSFTLEEKKYFIDLKVSSGHAECSIDREHTGIMASPFLRLALQGYFDGLVQRNLVAVYSYADSDFDPRAHLKKEQLTPADELHLFMSMNLFSQDTREKVFGDLVTKNYLDPNTTLGALAHKIMKEIVDTPVHDEAINNILFSFSLYKKHVLTPLSITLLTQLANALNTQEGKKDAGENFLRILYNHDVAAIPDAENLTKPLYSLINSFLQLYSAREQEIIITDVLRYASYLYHHPVLHTTYRQILLEKPKKGSDLGTLVILLAKSGDVVKHKEKIARMRQLIPDIDTEASAVNAYKAILKLDLTELYDAMNKRMLAPIDFPSDPTKHRKPRWWAYSSLFLLEAKGLISVMLRKGKPLHQELRKFLDTILPLLFLAPPTDYAFEEHLDAIKAIAKMVIEGKFEEYYPMIEKFFHEFSQAPEKPHEMSAQIIEILKYVMQQYATTKEESLARLIERITPYFFKIALNVGLFPFDALVEVFDFTQEHPPVQLKNVIATYVDRFREKAKKAFEDKEIEKEKYDAFLEKLKTLV